MNTPNGLDRRPLAVVVTTDGRRLQLPVGGPGLVEATLLSLIRSILVGLEEILGQIVVGRGDGGTRRIGRS